MRLRAHARIALVPSLTGLALFFNSYPALMCWAFLYAAALRLSRWVGGACALLFMFC